MYTDNRFSLMHTQVPKHAQQNELWEYLKISAPTTHKIVIS